MSEYKKKILLGAVFSVIIAVGLAVAAMSIAPNLGTTTQSTVQLLGAPSVLIVQLTDPPIVPAGTTSLNLTYTAINLLVSEPSIQTGTTTTTTVTGSSTITSTITTSSTNQKEVTPQTVTITPKAAVTIDLLKLQNISQTIASANLPSGSTIYSVSFIVSSITIDINGVISPVTLATGGNTLLVTLVNPAVLRGTNAVLLDLNPTIIDTPTGYQMIPSSVGVIRPQSEVSEEQEQIGNQQQLTNEDHNEFEQATGQVSASLLTLSVSGSTTTVTVQVNNTGSSPVRLEAIGLHGNFTSQACATSTSTTTASSHDNENRRGCETPNEVVFIPIVTAATTTSSSSTSSSSSSTSSMSTTTTTTSTTKSCVSGQLTLVNAGGGRSDDGEDGHQLLVNPGQCLTLTFSGTISFGESGNVLVPSTTSGQNYVVHVIASNGAEMKLSCILPISSTSCTVTSNNQGQDNNNQGQDS